MFRWIPGALRATAPFRVIYNVISIVCIIFTFGSVLYYGFFDHRTWMTERIAASYSAVEAQQTVVLQLLISTIPSRANGDAAPSRDKIAALQTALIQLSGKVTQVDIVSADMAEASDLYRDRIATLAGALVRFNPNEDSSQAELQLAVDRWDVAARTYADAVENHIGSFTRTVPSSV